jgi:hypothetical protein
MIRGRMKHLTGSGHEPIGRVLDQAEIRFMSGGSWIGCTMEIYSRPQDDWIVKLALERWLSWSGKNVDWKVREEAMTDPASGINWFETRFNASFGDLQRGILLEKFPDKKLGGETGPRFQFQSMVKFH